MYFDRVSVRDFRNYERQQVEWFKGVNLLIGDNAQGKTNLLEAMFLFAAGKSHRVAKDREMIRFGCNQASVESIFYAGGRTLEGRVDLFRDRRKEIRIGGVQLPKLADLMGCINIVFFSPENMELVGGSPQTRRRFLDLSISQLRPNYCSILQQYLRVLLHRNAVIRKSRAGQANYGMLAVFDEKLALLGADVMLHRSLYLERLREIAQTIHRFLTRDQEELVIQYDPSFKYTGDFTKKELFEALKEELEKSYETDLKNGFTSKGPHRDDFTIRIGGREARHYGSQGQRRTAVISLKLSEMEFVHDDRGEYPVVLLDDILSELDEKRQEYLLEFVRDKQVFITDTGRYTERLIKDAAAYRVEQGTVQRIL